MSGGENYTLNNYGYFEVMKIISEGLGVQGIPHAIVGGSGIQARIAELFNTNEGLALPNINSTQFLFRPTKDVDVTTISEPQDLARFFDTIQRENEPRLGITPKSNHRAIFRYDSGNRRGQVSVSFNYQHGPKDLMGLEESFYEDCIGTAETLGIQYNNELGLVSVARPEFLVASKLTRGAPKDVVDISNLLQVIRTYSGGGSRESFDEDLVRHHLREAGKEEYMGRLDEIKAQVLK